MKENLRIGIKVKSLENSDGTSDSGADHRIIAHADETHHFDVSRHR